jgi:hypothetical protein
MCGHAGGEVGIHSHYDSSKLRLLLLLQTMVRTGRPTPRTTPPGSWASSPGHSRMRGIEPMRQHCLAEVPAAVTAHQRGIAAGGVGGEGRQTKRG